MQLNKLTITGADDSISPLSLEAISKIYGFVEWGILMSESRVGTPRYPSQAFIDGLRADYGSYSAHLCGKLAKDVLELGRYDVITNLNPVFTRVQLNYNFKHTNLYNLDGLLNFLRGYEDKSVILQYNKDNADTLNHFMNFNILPANVHFLYDSSGGNGVAMDKVGIKLGNQYTGYAGGFNSGNLDYYIDKISENSLDDAFWVDLETGARTDDVFDLVKVMVLIDKANKRII